MRSEAWQDRAVEIDERRAASKLPGGWEAVQKQHTGGAALVGARWDQIEEGAPGRSLAAPSSSALNELDGFVSPLAAMICRLGSPDVIFLGEA